MAERAARAPHHNNIQFSIHYKASMKIVEEKRVLVDESINGNSGIFPSPFCLSLAARCSLASCSLPAPEDLFFHCCCSCSTVQCISMPHKNTRKTYGGSMSVTRYDSEKLATMRFLPLDCSTLTQSSCPHDFRRDVAGKIESMFSCWFSTWVFVIWFAAHAHKTQIPFFIDKYLRNKLRLREGEEEK